VSRWWGSCRPEVSMARPRFSASGRSASVASSAMRDRSECSGVKDRWSARLSRSSASVKVDRAGVDGVEAVDEFAGVAVRIVAGDVEKCLRDRQRGAQFVGGVGCESLLFGDVCFEAGEHGVEGVGELAELVIAAFQLDSVGERSGRGHACRVRDASQGGEHAAGENPPAQETERRCAPRCPRSGSRSAAQRSSVSSGCPPPHRPGCLRRSTGLARTC
jgi:hypothetical protein